MPTYYPLYLNIENKLCVVVGGGTVAERKVNALLEAKARVRVVSPDFTPFLDELRSHNLIEGISACYSPEVLEQASLIFAATDNPVVNAQVIANAAQRGIFANSADAPNTADFITPASIRRGDLLLTVATGGNNPVLSARIVSELEIQFGEEYAAFVELLGQKRDYLKEAVANPAERKAALVALVDARVELLELLRSGEIAFARSRAAEIIEGASSLASRPDRTQPPQRTD